MRNETYYIGNLAIDRGPSNPKHGRYEQERWVHNIAKRYWKAYEEGKCTLVQKRVMGETHYIAQWRV